MELRHLRYFLAVAEKRNFTRAAEYLNIAQPPLSAQIKALETELGVLLFKRLPHGAELTEAGEAFMIDARVAVDAAARAKSAAMGARVGLRGRLMVGCTTSAAHAAVMGTTINAFHRLWAEVDIAFDERDTTTDLYDAILRNEIDVAFLRPSGDEPRGIHLTRLQDEAMVVALPANHRLAARSALRLIDLREEPIIMLPRGAGAGLRDEICSCCQTSGFTPVLGPEARRMGQSLALVAASLGAAVVPISVSHIKPEGVVYVHIEGVTPIARLALAKARHRRSAILQNFIDLLPRLKGNCVPAFSLGQSQ